MVYLDYRDGYNIVNSIVTLINQEGSCRLLVNSLTYTIYEDCNVILVNDEYIEITDKENDDLKAVFKISDISGVVS